MGVDLFLFRRHGMAREIELTQGQVALVDDEDYERIIDQGPWFADWNAKRKVYYASTRTRRKDGHKKKYMHRLIMDAPANKQVDHKNKCTLDNRKDNLRICTQSENMSNRGPTRANTSGYKGVYFCTWVNRWRAGIRKNGKTYHLGRFDTPEEAAEAYNHVAMEYHGEFAVLNDIPDNMS